MVPPIFGNSQICYVSFKVEAHHPELNPSPVNQMLNATETPKEHTPHQGN